MDVEICLHKMANALEALLGEDHPMMADLLEHLGERPAAPAPAEPVVEPVAEPAPAAPPANSDAQPDMTTDNPPAAS